jgi:hypothetical protein
MKTRTFCNIKSCILVGKDRRFRGTYCLHHQCDDTDDDLVSHTKGRPYIESRVLRL